MKTNRLPVVIGCLVGCLAGAAWGAEKPKPISIAEVKQDGPVDFHKQILPILQKKCLACHNATDAESDLVLETPQTILKGGSMGPAAVAGKGAESLLLKLAARQDEPVMPPEGNKVGAKPLTPEELGLIKLWIDQGVMGSAQSGPEPIKWQPLPAGVNPIYAVAVSPDGQWAAASRANQVFLYHVPTKREYGRLTDPAIISSGLYKNPGVAHVDLVQSMKFSPNSQLLVTGEYRTIKFWQRKQDSRKQEWSGVEPAVKSLALSPDGKLAALGCESGKIQLFELATAKLLRTLEGQHQGAVTGIHFSSDSARLVSGAQDKRCVIWLVADGKVESTLETPAAVNAVLLAAQDQQVITGGADNAIRIWAVPAAAKEGESATPAKPVKEITAHGGPITSLAALPHNAAQFVSSSQDGTVRIWDIANGNQVQQLSHGAPVRQVAVRKDGQRLVSVSDNHTAKLWNGGNFQQIAELKGDYRSGIQLDTLQRTVAIAKRHVEGANGDLKQANERKSAEEKNVQAADEASKKSMEELNKKIEAAKKPVEEKQAADKALEEAKAAVTKNEEAKKTADAAGVTAEAAVTKAKSEVDAAAKAQNDAETAVKTATDALAKAKEAVDKDQNNEELKKQLADAEKNLQESEAKRKAATDDKAAKEKAAADTATAKAAAEETKKKADADLKSAQEAAKKAEESANKLKDPAQKAIDEKNTAEKASQSAARSAERAKEAAKKAVDAIPGFDTAVKQAEERQKQAEAAVQQGTAAATAAEKPIQTVAFAPDGLTFVTGGDDQIVHTWDAESGAAVEALTGQGANILAVACTGAGDVLSIAANQTAWVWDTNAPWELTRTIGSPDSGDVFIDRVTALDFSPDGRLLATGGGEPSRSGQLKIFQTADGQLLKEIKDAHSDVIYGLEFSPDGKQIASCSADRFAKVFDVEAGKLVRSFEGHTHHVLGVTWRADGRLLATSGADLAIKVWDVRTGDQQRTIQGFGKEVTAVRFIAETDNVVASCGDATVQMANATNGRNVRGFSGAGDFVHSCGVSANGKLIVAGGQDSVVRIWKAEGEEFAKFAAPK